MNKVVGIDEVGRGCWAGPLVAAAVILAEPIEGLNDSKKVSAVNRGILSEKILLTAECGVGWVSPGEVDVLGLTEAVRLAMNRALAQITTQYDGVIVDGNYDFIANGKSQAVIKADGSIPAVSAASIIAKVARDAYMAKLPPKYTAWQFDKHVGYGTALHRQLLLEHGVSDLHRKSYKPIKALL